MKEKINDGVLYVLKKEQDKIVTDYVLYENFFEESLEILYLMSLKKFDKFYGVSVFEKIKQHIIESDLNKLNGFFKYCVDYTGTYQGVKMTNNLKFIDQGIDFIENEIKEYKKKI